MDSLSRAVLQGPERGKGLLKATQQTCGAWDGIASPESHYREPAIKTIYKDSKSEWKGFPTSRGGQLRQESFQRPPKGPVIWLCLIPTALLEPTGHT